MFIPIPILLMLVVCGYYVGKNKRARARFSVSIKTVYVAFILASQDDMMVRTNFRQGIGMTLIGHKFPRPATREESFVISA